MRKMRSHLGAKAGKQRRAKGLPEVQKPVLEHAPKEVAAGPARTEPAGLAQTNGCAFRLAFLMDAFQLAARAAQVMVYSYKPSFLLGPVAGTTGPNLSGQFDCVY